jgi:hypothetical protein
MAISPACIAQFFRLRGTPACQRPCHFHAVSCTLPSCFPFRPRPGRSAISNRRSGTDRLQKLRVLHVRHIGRHSGGNRHRRARRGVQLGRASQRSPPHHRSRSAIFPSNNPSFAPAGAGPRAFGIGDIELGIKYRFVQETKHRPMIGTFTMFEMPTGSAARGLGVGRTWYKVPLWVQKSFGPRTTYGGGGVTLVNAPGYRNYPFAGWLVQRDLGKKVTLGTEIFYHGPEGWRQRRPGRRRWSTSAVTTSFATRGFSCCFVTATPPSGKKRTTPTWGSIGLGASRRRVAISPQEPHSIASLLPA